MDNKCMYIVQRVFDSYDDREELNVAAFLNKFEADAYCKECYEKQPKEYDGYNVAYVVQEVPLINKIKVVNGKIEIGPINGKYISINPFMNVLSLTFDEAKNYIDGDLSLPTKEELDFIIRHKEELEKFIYIKNFEWYWTSEEYDEISAWAIRTSDGLVDVEEKSNSCFAIPVKRFVKK